MRDIVSSTCVSPTAVGMPIFLPASRKSCQSDVCGFPARPRECVPPPNGKSLATKKVRSNSRAAQQIPCQRRVVVLCLFLTIPAEIAGSIVDVLNGGVSVAWIAARERLRKNGVAGKWRHKRLKRLDPRREMVWSRKPGTYKIWYTGARLTGAFRLRSARMAKLQSYPTPKPIRLFVRPIWIGRRLRERRANCITNELESAATPAVSGARFRAPNGGRLGSYKVAEKGA